MKKALFLITLGFIFAGFVIANAANIVPTEIQMPGTQPKEVTNLDTPDKCDNCHGGYNPSVEPAHNWRGSMMANAGRDPIFWATLAVAERGFDGAGDLCLRCHSTSGWVAGRSTPTDGSGLLSGDADGVECDLCHKLTNPDNSEHLGVQTPPFVANDESASPTGYYGSGMYTLWPSSDKLGPYANADARHQFQQSKFHRSGELCGTCHDVSNPAVGDLAPGNGAQLPLEPGTYSGVLGSPVETKAAFNNFPYQYGVVERTFSEWKASDLSTWRVKDYLSLPADLQGGALKTAYEAAVVAGTGGDYEDGSPRYFTCQTCHLRPVTGPGCDKPGVINRKDQPKHDMTGGNYWVPDAIQYLDLQGKLLVGGGLTTAQKSALNDGKIRALQQLNLAASLSVSGNTLKIVNQTGHKLISGYPEGRRMWLNTKWYDDAGTLIREDGAYGPIGVTVGGVAVESLVNPADPNTKVYEAHYAMTQAWADKLVNVLGAPANLPLAFNRLTGSTEMTLGDLAASAPGTYRETFHFVLNNKVAKDNRIPPYGMKYDETKKRNALPVPETQYGNPGPGGTYSYWDTFSLNPPAGATYASIRLLYQPTSWEYIQFLDLANNGSNAFLANEGKNLLEAWLNTGMAAPQTMAITTWGTAPALEARAESLITWSVDRNGGLISPASTFAAGDTVGFVVRAVNRIGLPIAAANVSLEVKDPSGALAATLTGLTDANGLVTLTWKSGRKQAKGDYTGQVVNIVKSGYVFNGAVGQPTVTFTIQ